MITKIFYDVTHDFTSHFSTFSLGETETMLPDSSWVQPKDSCFFVDMVLMISSIRATLSLRMASIPIVALTYNNSCSEQDSNNERSVDNGSSKSESMAYPKEDSAISRRIALSMMRCFQETLYTSNLPIGEFEGCGADADDCGSLERLTL